MVTTVRSFTELYENCINQNKTANYVVSSRILQETLNGMCEIPLSRCHLQIVLQNITKHNNKKK